jgi:transcriptional regulator with XRE-family HTH domain
VTSEAGRRGPEELAELLRSLRTAAGLSQPEVARRTGLSQAKLSRVENGRSVLSADEALELAALYQADPDHREQLLRLAAEVEAGYLDARTVIQRGTTARLQERFAALEAGAATVRSFQPGMVLGVLQTTAYAAAVFGTAEDDPLVVGRAERSRRLLAEPGRRWVLVQAEGALRWLVHSPGLMAAQVRRIAEIAEEPHVEFGLIRWQTPVDVFPSTGFHLYDSSTAVVGTAVGSAFLQDEASLQVYWTQFDRLVELADTGTPAIAALYELAAEYDGMA